MKIHDSRKKMTSKHMALKGVIALLLVMAFFNNVAASTVASWDLMDYNNDGLRSDFSLGSSPVAPPTGDSQHAFGSIGETGCMNSSDGDTCDPIIFDSGAIGASVFTSGFNMDGIGAVFPKTTGTISADITGGVLTFSALPFAIFLTGPSEGDVYLPPGSFAVFGSSMNLTPDYSFLTVDDLTALGNGQYGVVVSWLHQGSSCLGCFDSIDARIRLEGVMTVVPVPAAIWLLATGIIALFSAGRLAGR